CVHVRRPARKPRETPRIPPELAPAWPSLPPSSCRQPAAPRLSPPFLGFQPVRRLRKLKKRLLHNKSRASQIDAQPSCAFAAEYRTFVKDDLGALIHQILEALFVESQFPAVYPQQVGAIRLHRLY